MQKLFKGSAISLVPNNKAITIKNNDKQNKLLTIKTNDKHVFFTSNKSATTKNFKNSNL